MAIRRDEGAALSIPAWGSLVGGPPHRGPAPRPTGPAAVARGRGAPMAPTDPPLSDLLNSMKSDRSPCAACRRWPPTTCHARDDAPCGTTPTPSRDSAPPGEVGRIRHASTPRSWAPDVHAAAGGAHRFQSMAWPRASPRPPAPAPGRDGMTPTFHRARRARGRRLPGGAGRHRARRALVPALRLPRPRRHPRPGGPRPGGGLPGPRGHRGRARPRHPRAGCTQPLPLPRHPAHAGSPRGRRARGRGGPGGHPRRLRAGPLRLRGPRPRPDLGRHRLAPIGLGPPRGGQGAPPGRRRRARGRRRLRGVVVSAAASSTRPSPPSTPCPRVQAVDGRAAILLDGGVRRGRTSSRPWPGRVRRPRGPPHGVGAERGRSGRRPGPLEFPWAELDEAMALCGCPRVADLTPDLVVAR